MREFFIFILKKMVIFLCDLKDSDMWDLLINICNLFYFKKLITNIDKFKAHALVILWRKENSTKYNQLNSSSGNKLLTKLINIWY